MTDLQFNQIQAELSNIALRLITNQSTSTEQMSELIEVAAILANELRDLKAELIQLGDTLIDISSTGRIGK